MVIILFLNHKTKSCGVYQYGIRLYNILENSVKNKYLYKEIESYEEYTKSLDKYKPDLIIYNYHKFTMPWLNILNIQQNVKNIAIPHESKETMFDIILSIDPTETEIDNVFNMPRPIYENVELLQNTYNIKDQAIFDFINYNEGDDIPIFGSFGFGFHNKGFEKIVKLINHNYEKAIIKLLITSPDCDPNSSITINEITQLCNSVNTNPNIKLMITNNFFTNEEILLFLSSNTANIFLYETIPQRGEVVGISSVIDYAISAKKPFVISDSIMFRNIYCDDICVYKTDVKNAIENSKNILPNLLTKYSNQNLIDKVDEVIDKSTNENKTKKINKMKGIYYNSRKAICSIHESGLMVYNCLKNSDMYHLDYTEEKRFFYNYDFAIVNEHFSVNNWVTEQMVQNFNKPVFCVVTEVSFSNNCIAKSPKFYTAYIVLDSSITPKKNIYAFPRPLEDNITPPTHKQSNKIIVGSFGFATIGKSWHKIVEETQKDFDEALIRFNIPHATYVASSKKNINDITSKCLSIIKKPKIKLEVTNHNFSKEELIKWCSENTINCFIYERDDKLKAGLCATADQAIVAERPLLVSKDTTFRHIHKYINYYPNISIKEAIEKTKDGVKKMKEDWSSKNFLVKFQDILSSYMMSNSFVVSKTINISGNRDLDRKVNYHNNINYIISEKLKTKKKSTKIGLLKKMRFPL